MTPPSPGEVAAYAAECRMLRAAALRKGLDPDAVLPEDILLLDDTGDGLEQEMKDARDLLAYERSAAGQ